MHASAHDDHDGVAEADVTETSHNVERRRSAADWHAEEYPHDYDSEDHDAPHRADGEVASPDEPYDGVTNTHAAVPNGELDSSHTHNNAHDKGRDTADEPCDTAAGQQLSDGSTNRETTAPATSADTHGSGAESSAHATRVAPSVRPQKRSEQARAPRVNLLNVHKVSAIPEGVNTPRSRTLCEKYTINPRELSRRTLQDFEKPGVPADLANMRYRSYMNRQQAHMTVLLPEYTQILQEQAELERRNADNEHALEAQRAVHEEQQRRASEAQAVQERQRQLQQQQQQRRRSSACASVHASSPTHGRGDGQQRRGSVQAGRVASVQERRRLLSEIQHMELVRKMLEKDKEVYQRLRDLADEREIYRELHHLQSDEPKYRQFKELKSLAHVAAQYSRGRYRSPKRALEPAVLEEAMGHLSAQRERARSNSRGRE